MGSLLPLAQRTELAPPHAPASTTPKQLWCAMQRKQCWSQGGPELSNVGNFLSDNEIPAEVAEAGGIQAAANL